MNTEEQWLKGYCAHQKSRLETLKLCLDRDSQLGAFESYCIDQGRIEEVSRSIGELEERIEALACKAQPTGAA